MFGVWGWSVSGPGAWAQISGTVTNQHHRQHLPHLKWPLEEKGPECSISNIQWAGTTWRAGRDGGLGLISLRQQLKQHRSSGSAGGLPVTSAACVSKWTCEEKHTGRPASFILPPLQFNRWCLLNEQQSVHLCSTESATLYTGRNGRRLEVLRRLWEKPEPSSASINSLIDWHPFSIYDAVA